MHSFKYTLKSRTLPNEVSGGNWSIHNRALLIVGLIVLLLFAACDSDSARSQGAGESTNQVSTESKGRPQTKVDSLEQQITELKANLTEANNKIKNLETPLNEEQKGSGGGRFLIMLFLLTSFLGLLYFFRNSIRRSYQQWKGIEHKPKQPVYNQPANESVSPKRPVRDKTSETYSERVKPKAQVPKEQPTSVNTPQPPLESVVPLATTPSTSPAPAAAPQKRITPEEALSETTTEREDVGLPKAPETSPKVPTSLTIRYSYGPIDGTLKAFGEEDYDERTTFRIEVAQDGQKATYTVVDNERQQRNVIENQAAYTEAVEYRGEGEGHYANARIQPGTLQRAGDRWRIVDRLIIDRV